MEAASVTAHSGRFRAEDVQLRPHAAHDLHRRHAPFRNDARASVARRSSGHPLRRGNTSTPTTASDASAMGEISERKDAPRRGRCYDGGIFILAYTRNLFKSCYFSGAKLSHRCFYS